MTRRGVTVPPEAAAAAAARSPLTRGGPFSDLADRKELLFREEIEEYPMPLVDVSLFIERKCLRELLGFALKRAGLAPDGVVVELGAGTCWMAAQLALSPKVSRVVAVEFSERRLTQLAPVAIALLDAPAEKIERRIADFYAHGLDDETADWVLMDAAFHHASDPVRRARIAYRLLRPGGRFVLLREPTLSLLRRRRDHGIEGVHGSFEHEYTARGYLRALEEAGFVDARKYRAAVGFDKLRRRIMARAPISWLNGTAFASYTYVASRPWP